MDVLIVTQYFWPENFRINDLSEALVDNGHNVTVLTGVPNYPEGSIFVDFKSHPAKYNRMGGVDIVRVPIVTRGKNKGVRLVLNYLSFIFSALTFGLWGLRGKKFDLIFTFGVSPISVAIPGIVKAWFSGGRTVLWVLDLWPDTLVDLGVVKKAGLLHRVLSKVISHIYNSTDIVLGQSPSMAKKISMHKSGSEGVGFFPNWAEDIFLSNVSGFSGPLLECSRDALKILFAGNMGESQDFPSVIKAIELSKLQNVHWFFLGDGRSREYVVSEVSRLKLCNVSLLDAVPVDKVPSYYKEADVLFVSLKKGEAFSVTIPGKLQSYLAAGRPILGMMDGDGKAVIEESGVGFCACAGDADILANYVGLFDDMSKEELDTLGDNGKDYYVSNFSKEKMVERLVEYSCS